MFASKQFLFVAPMANYKVFGVRIDTTNSNPESALTYTDDAVGVTDWTTQLIFKDIKPCLLKNGVVQYYLNPNDFSKKIDGVNSDITSGNDGDVMIEIPKFAYMLYTDGIYQYIKITNSDNAQSIDSRFHYYAHMRDTEGDRDKLYVSAYLGYYDSIASKIRSLSNKTPTTSQTMTKFRTYAQANGTGYDMLSFYPLTALQCLYVIKYKNLDSQSALGKGYVTGNSAKHITGGTDVLGMYYGETTGKIQMKFAGIEDLWGNCWYYIDGIYADASRYILTAFKNFNNIGSGYTYRISFYNTGGLLTKIQGTSEIGFLPKTTGGSISTYYCDYVDISASKVFMFGGSWAFDNWSGIFQFYGYGTGSTGDTTLASRLMYL